MVFSLLPSQIATVSCVLSHLFNRVTDYAGGIRMRDADKDLQVIVEGGGTPRLRMAGEFVIFKAR
jgi:hypothetical protein